ncbi:MAG: aldolase/citrate lyase family protein [Planctomycetaceae bacterium]
MQWINRTRLTDGVLAGTFLNLGSPAAVEIAAAIGFDWLLLDLEHGAGTEGDLRSLLMACRGSQVAPIVRLRSVNEDAAKYALDSGAAGVMFPWVSSVAEAERAVRCVKYPPQGRRGVAGVIRATGYGANWGTYFREANEHSFVVVQIETPEAVAAADDIAAVEGVDSLFVGPLDLSANMGHAGDFSPEPFQQHLTTVVQACERHGKSAGILSKPGFVQQHLEMGFRLFALGSDAQGVTQGLQRNLQEIRNL